MSVALEFVGHACFRVWEDGRPTVVMDPYHFEAAQLPDSGDRLQADTVIVSSLTDDAHSNVGLVARSPRVINALDVALGTPAQVNGEQVVAIPAKEHPDHTDHDPMDNAMYAFRAGGRADGLWVAHVGDIGYGIPNAELAPWQGKCDVLLAITGERNTVTIAELVRMIECLQPKWVVPMHYALPPLAGDEGGGMTWVDAFLNALPSAPVYLARHHTVELPLPLPPPPGGAPSIVVLEPSGYVPTAGVPRFTTTQPV